MTLAASCTVLVVLGTAGCSGAEAPEVALDEVTRARVVEVVEAPATVTARASATLTAAADGRVAELRVRDGERVRAGQIVLRVESAAARQALAEAQQADAQAAASGSVTLPGLSIDETASRADARAEEAFGSAREAAEAIPGKAERAQALAAIAAAAADYATARAEADEAVQRFNEGLGSLAQAISSLGQAQRVQTSAALAVARRTVAGLVVRAPISGVVSLGGAGAAGQDSGDIAGLPPALQGAAEEALGAAGGLGSAQSGESAVGTLTEGSPVSSGQTLATITDVSTLSLTAEVDETDVLLVRRGVSGRVELDALPGVSYGARVRSVDVAPTTSVEGGVSYGVRLTLGAGRTADGELAPPPRPGMSAYVDLRVRRADRAISVPVSAVVRDGDRDSVWVVLDSVVRRRYVRLGAQGQERVQVVRGLRPGETVVVTGADRVSDGLRLEQ